MRKGKTNNPNGRPKGSPNKVTSDVKAFITDIIESNRETIVSDLQALEPYQRLTILERLMRYVIAPEQAKSNVLLETIDLPQDRRPVIIFTDDFENDAEGV